MDYCQDIVGVIEDYRYKDRRNIRIFTVNTFSTNYDSRTRLWRTKINTRNSRQS